MKVKLPYDMNLLRVLIFAIMAKRKPQKPDALTGQFLYDLQTIDPAEQELYSCVVQASAKVSAKHEASATRDGIRTRKK